MKKAVWVIFFIAVLFAGDRLIGWFFQQQVKNSQFRYSRMYRGDGDADILIVGNSRGLSLYQPYMEKTTGLKTFSLCYYSMPCEIATVLTKDYLDRYKNVKSVIVEVSVVEMSDDQLLSGFSTYMPYSKRLDSVLKTEVPDAWRYSQFSHIYRFNNEVFQRALYYRNKLDNDWYFDHTITERMIEQTDQYSVDFKGPEKHMQDIKQLADYCRANHINVKFILGPFFPTYKVHGLQQYLKRIEEVTGYKVYDYSHAIQDHTAFSDYLHANIKGGKMIVDLMIKDGLLPVADSSKLAQMQEQ